MNPSQFEKMMHEIEAIKRLLHEIVKKNDGHLCDLCEKIKETPNQY